jgi:hypothetical protein
LGSKERAMLCRVPILLHLVNAPFRAFNDLTYSGTAIVESILVWLKVASYKRDQNSRMQIPVCIITKDNMIIRQLIHISHEVFTPFSSCLVMGRARKTSDEMTYSAELVHNILGVDRVATFARSATVIGITRVVRPLNFYDDTVQVHDNMFFNTIHINKNST